MLKPLSKGRKRKTSDVFTAEVTEANVTFDSNHEPITGVQGAKYNPVPLYGDY